VPPQIYRVTAAQDERVISKYSFVMGYRMWLERARNRPHLEFATHMRLVKGMDPKVTTERLIAHIRKQGFFVTSTEPDANIRRSHAKAAWVVQQQNANAYRTRMDIPIAADVIHAVESAWTLNKNT